MASLISFFFLIISTLSTTITQTSYAQQTCSKQKFTNNKLYNHCNDLPHLKSSLHWSLNQSQNTLSIAFLAAPPTTNGWISWAINPTSDGMAGSQALLAYKSSNGSMAVKTYNISSYISVMEGGLSFEVVDKRAEFSGGVMRLFATVVLPEKGATMVNHVWQVGPAVVDGSPVKHAFQPANLAAKGRLDLLSGESSGGGGNEGGSGNKKRNIHGILNAVSWGFLFPIGIIIARYLRAFPSADPTWFYLHAFCQVSAYAIGVAGWATGLKLGSDSKGVTFNTHRNIGITLFSLATVQVFALFLRPNKDHKLRFYWNIYHHGLGYAILVLGVLNVFKGLDILSPQSKWRSAYIIVISTLGAIALLLEVITWIMTLKRKSSKSTKPYDNNQQPLAP